MPSLSRNARVFGEAPTVAQYFASKLLQASYRVYRSRGEVAAKAKQKLLKVSEDAEEKMRVLMSGGSPMGRRKKRMEKRKKKEARGRGAAGGAAGVGERRKPPLTSFGSGESLDEERNPKHKLKPLLAAGMKANANGGVLESKDDDSTTDDDDSDDEGGEEEKRSRAVSKSQVSLESKSPAAREGKKNAAANAIAKRAGAGSKRKKALGLGGQKRSEGESSSSDESETDSEGERAIV